MKHRIPNYYRDFRCLGANCKDNCCIGWEIDIDEKSHTYYQSVTGSFGQRLRSSISADAAPHFILQEERCPFLDQQNLCEIFQTLGKDKLCDICANHPRFYEWFCDLTEIGLGFCCEAVGRLMFTQQAPITFLMEEASGTNTCEPLDKTMFQALYLARETAFSIVQDRTCTIKKRAGLLLLFAEEVQTCLPENPDAIHAIAAQYRNPNSAPSQHKPLSGCERTVPRQLAELLHLYLGFESLDETFPNLLQGILTGLPDILKNRQQFCAANAQTSIDYEHILVYFIDRYFLKAAFDLDILSKVHLALSSYLMIYHMDIFHWIHHDFHFTLDDRISIVKCYSKEIEYSQENLDALHAESCVNPLFDSDALLSMLLY